MRITMKVAGAGSNGVTRMPWLEVDIERDLTDEEGDLDEAKVRALYKDFDGVQIGSDDGIEVLAVATEILKQTGNACRQMIENRRDGNTNDAHDEAECADDRHAERNMRKGKWVFVRTDIWYSRAAARMNIRVDVQNPKGVVGVAERIANEYAVIEARIINNIVGQLREGNKMTTFSLSGGEGCPKVFEEAREVDVSLGMKAKRENCERRTASGHCSPCDFACPMFRDGKCVEWKHGIDSKNGS